MRRGDIVTVALPGEYGKPGPAVIIQNDKVPSESTIVCLLSSDPLASAPYRQQVQPNDDNGLRQTSFVMAEKLQLVRKDKCGAVIGRLGPADVLTLNVNLTFVLGLGD